MVYHGYPLIDHQLWIPMVSQGYSWLIMDMSIMDIRNPWLIFGGPWLIMINSWIAQPWLTMDIRDLPWIAMDWPLLSMAHQN